MKCPYLIGKRIYLRPLDQADLKKGYLDWINDPRINRFLMAGTFPTSVIELKEYYEKVKRSRSDAMFAICVKKDDRYIGNIKLGDISWIDRRANCGRMIGDRKYWGKGYGTEALQLVIDYAFNTLHLNRVYNTIIEDNIGAIRSCEKSGMKMEGRFPQFRFTGGAFKDVLQYGITKDAYDRIKKTKRGAGR